MVAQLPIALDGERVKLRCWRVDDAATLSTLVQANLDHLRPWMQLVVSEPLTEAERRDLIAGWVRARDAGLEFHHDKENVASAGVPRRLGYRFIGDRPSDEPAPGGAGVSWVWRTER